MEMGGSIPVTHTVVPHLVANFLSKHQRKIALSPSNSSTHNQTQRAFAWTEIEKGVITASYFYGNGAVMIVASVFINKFNTKHVFR